MSDYNAVKARTKYGVTIWADAFVRDTLDLEGDEIGAYILILFAMWARESCDLPDDDRKLARIARKSKTTWVRRIRPALEPFFEVADGVWISGRLRKEAAKTEAFLKSQSDRRSGTSPEKNGFTSQIGSKKAIRETQNISDKSLERNDGGPTGDDTGVQSGDQPTQETKYIGGGDGSARERLPDDPTDRERILHAIGADPVSGMTGPNGRQLGRMADMQVAAAWRDDLSLSIDEIVDVIGEVMARKTDGPPSSFKYFDDPMRRFAGIKSRPTLTPIDGGANDRDRDQNCRAPSTPSGRAHENLLRAFAGTLPEG